MWVTCVTWRHLAREALSGLTPIGQSCDLGEGSPGRMSPERGGTGVICTAPRVATAGRLVVRLLAHSPLCVSETLDLLGG